MDNLQFKTTYFTIKKLPLFQCNVYLSNHRFVDIFISHEESHIFYVFSSKQ